MEGLEGVMKDLIADGNTVVLVDHDVNVLKKADWLIEMGPVRVPGAAVSLPRVPCKR